MTHTTVRTLIALALIVLLTIPFPALAQTKADPKTKTEEKDKSKKKNSDVEDIGNRNINKGSINFISLEKEIAMGRQMAVEIERQVKLIDDPVITEYVNRVGQNLVRNSDAKVPFTIKVIESDEINAMALPGGFFYVNTGLIRAADDESELAAVMAHEIAHVTARHGTENATKAQLVNIASLPLIFLGGAAGFGIRQAAGILIPLQFLQFTRKAEAEADYLGVQYLYKTGYDPTAAVTFFEKIQAKETARPGTIPKIFGTHPPTGDRIEITKKNIAAVLPEKQEYVVTTSEFNKIKTLLERIENRDSAREDPNKPSLRRTTKPPATTDDETAQDKEQTKPEDREPDSDDRPKLKRRTGDPLLP